MGMSSRADMTATIAAGARGLVNDYAELLKPRLSSLVLITTVLGFYMGYMGPADGPFFMMLVHTALGTGLVAGGAMVLNQYMERSTDALMERTRERPIPQGRVDARDALAYGMVLAGAGSAYLALLVNGLTAFLGVLTIGSYLLLYTPLKTRTPLCTLVGAIPGAIPPMMGYAAAAGLIDARAWTLFAILFVWQLPHFLAIAWLYREDYARGGQLMLPVVDSDGAQTSRQVLSFSLTLLPVTLVPAVVGMAGAVYFAAALFLGVVFLAFGWRLAVSRTPTAARQLFIVSVLYLPLLLGVMVLDRT